MPLSFKKCDRWFHRTSVADNGHFGVVQSIEFSFELFGKPLKGNLRHADRLRGHESDSYSRPEALAICKVKCQNIQANQSFCWTTLHFELVGIWVRGFTSFGEYGTGRSGGCG